MLGCWGRSIANCELLKCFLACCLLLFLTIAAAAVLAQLLFMRNCEYGKTVDVFCGYKWEEVALNGRRWMKVG